MFERQESRSRKTPISRSESIPRFRSTRGHRRSKTFEVEKNIKENVIPILSRRTTTIRDPVEPLYKTEAQRK